MVTTGQKDTGYTYLTSVSSPEIRHALPSKLHSSLRMGNANDSKKLGPDGFLSKLFKFHFPSMPSSLYELLRCIWIPKAFSNRRKTPILVLTPKKATRPCDTNC